MDVDLLRAEMPVTRQWAYFDHAAVAPITARAAQAMHDWAADVAANGHANSLRWGQCLDEARRLAGQLINADPLDVAFVKNTSEGIGIVAEGLPWQPGDNVVTAEEEYPANIYPWMNLKARGVELRLVPTRDRRVQIDDLRAAMDARTRLVSLSFVEFASGYRNDLDAVGSLCRERGILFFVDAIQGLGVLPLDVQQSPIDFLAADGHKWLLGPEGAGIFYIRRELVERLHPVGIGWNSVLSARDFSRIDFQLKPHAGRWESGTPNFAGIAGLGASLAVLLEIGVPALSERLLALTDELCARASQAGCEVYSPRGAAERSGIVSLIVPGADPRALLRHCRKQGIIINHRAGRVRLSPHAYNTEAEIERLIAALRAPTSQEEVGS